jgi:hypothetical protein
MKFIKAIIALSLASLALAAPSTQHRPGQYDNSVGGYDGDGEGSTTPEGLPVLGGGGLPGLPILGGGGLPRLPIPDYKGNPLPSNEDSQNPGGEDPQNPGGEDSQNPGGEGPQNPSGNYVRGIIPDGVNGDRGPFDGSTSYSSPRPSEYELDHTNTGLLGGSELGNAVNALLNGVAAGTTGQIWYAPSLSFGPCR